MAYYLTIVVLASLCICTKSKYLVNTDLRCLSLLLDVSVSLLLCLLLLLFSSGFSSFSGDSKGRVMGNGGEGADGGNSTSLMDGDVLLAAWLLLLGVSSPSSYFSALLRASSSTSRIVCSNTALVLRLLIWILPLAGPTNNPINMNIKYNGGIKCTRYISYKSLW
jgi:hypothetical protein